MFFPSLFVALLLSYLLGAIPFAVVVGRSLRGIDITRSGTGNAGALNTLRSAGPIAGVLVALLDGLKAALALLLGSALLGPRGAALCGAAAVAGHCFSPYLLYATRHERGRGWKLALRRSGGKGLASGVAVLLLLDWRLAAIVVAIFAVALLVLRKDSTWPSIVAVACATPLVWWLIGDRVTSAAVLIVSLIVIVKHLPDAREAFYVAQPEQGRG